MVQDIACFITRLLLMSYGLEFFFSVTRWIINDVVILGIIYVWCVSVYCGVYLCILL